MARRKVYELSAPLAAASAGAAHSARRRRAGVALARRRDRIAGALIAHAREQNDPRVFVARRVILSLQAPSGPKKDKLAHSQTPTAAVRQVARRAMGRITLSEG
ncbi:MAG: hypothetical protein ABSA66_04865 [Roseiarcus sp.]|jgi:hypothetical protein